MLVVACSAAAGYVRWQGAGLFLAQTQVFRWRELAPGGGAALSWPAATRLCSAKHQAGHFGKKQMIYSV